MIENFREFNSGRYISDIFFPLWVKFSCGAKLCENGYGLVCCELLCLKSLLEKEGLYEALSFNLRTP